MNIEKVRENFLNDVSSHLIDVYKDDGLHRHIVFKKPGTRECYFNLVTWPGELCISGDFGTYVFERLEDMFRFFRNDEGKPLTINPSYWHQKIQSVDTRCGSRKFSQDKLKQVMKYQFANPFEGTIEQQKECWEKIREEILNQTNNSDAHTAISDFYFEYGDEKFEFTDSWEFDFEDYTYNFLWCLYAIVWGIQKYDEMKMEKINNEEKNKI